MRLYSSVSAEEATESSNFFDASKSILTAVKPSKPRWSTLFGQKNPQQGQLCEILNSYAKNGVPQSKTFSSFEHSDFGTSLHYINNIHGSWKEFVNVTNMKEHEIKIQSAIWELVTTEVDYIHALQTVTEVNIQRRKPHFVCKWGKLQKHEREKKLNNNHAHAHTTQTLKTNNKNENIRQSGYTVRPKSHSRQLDFLTQNRIIIQHSDHLYVCNFFFSRPKPLLPLSKLIHFLFICAVALSILFGSNPITSHFNGHWSK